MKRPLKWLGIRARLLIVYVAILLFGFGGLTLVAGGQISAGARQDYEQRLKSEVTLIAQALAGSVNNFAEGNLSESDLKAAFSAYDTQINGVLTLFPLQNNHDPD